MNDKLELPPSLYEAAKEDEEIRRFVNAIEGLERACERIKDVKKILQEERKKIEISRRAKRFEKE